MATDAWFGPLSKPSKILDVPPGLDDGDFESYLLAACCLDVNRDEALDLRCDDGSRLSPSALDFFTNPLMARAASLLKALRIRKYRALCASTLRPLAATATNLETLELLFGASLDIDGVDELAKLPVLIELAISGLAETPVVPRMHLIGRLASLKRLQSLGMPHSYLAHREIDAVIEQCNLDELSVASQFDKDGERAIQECHERCTIYWGYLPG